MEKMEFLLKITLQKFYACHDLIAYIRKRAKRTDIYKEDIKGTVVDRELKVVVIHVKRTNRKMIDVYSASGDKVGVEKKIKIYNA